MRTADYIKHLTGLTPDEATAKLDTLTPRQRQVFLLMVEGHSQATIADRLGISPKTLDIHRADVLAKLGASSWQALVWYEVASKLAADLPPDLPNPPDLIRKTIRKKATA